MYLIILTFQLDVVYVSDYIYVCFFKGSIFEYRGVIGVTLSSGDLCESMDVTGLVMCTLNFLHVAGVENWEMKFEESGWWRGRDGGGFGHGTLFTGPGGWLRRRGCLGSEKRDDCA